MDHGGHAVQLNAQIRSLKQQLGRRPWLFARLAELEVLQGQGRRALKRLRAGVKQFPAYSSGHQVLGELLLARGEAEEAHRELLLASSCSDSGHASFELLVDGLATRDPEAARGLLEEAWSRDRLNSRLKDRMTRAGLISEPSFREILVPTEGERRARDEEIAALIRRLIAAVDEPVPAPPATPPAAEALPGPAGADTAAPQALAPGAAEPGVIPGPAPAAPPVPPGPEGGHKSLFLEIDRSTQREAPPRPIRSRALARVYDEQGYLELALGCDPGPAGHQPGPEADTAELLLQWRQDLERRIAERKP
jgi:hypothetical protein